GNRYPTAWHLGWRNRIAPAPIRGIPGESYPVRCYRIRCEGPAVPEKHIRLDSHSLLDKESRHDKTAVGNRRTHARNPVPAGGDRAEVGVQCHIVAGDGVATGTVARDPGGAAAAGRCRHVAVPFDGAEGVAGGEVVPVLGERVGGEREVGEGALELVELKEPLRAGVVAADAHVVGL